MLLSIFLMQVISDHPFFLYSCNLVLDLVLVHSPCNLVFSVLVTIYLVADTQDIYLVHKGSPRGRTTSVTTEIKCSEFHHLVHHDNLRNSPIFHIKSN